MTVKTLREVLATMPDDWEVNVALPKNRIERLHYVEIDPFADEEAGVLLWPDTVSMEGETR